MSRELFAGAASQVLTCALMNPFDVIRLRLQSHESNFSILRTTRELLALPLRHGLYRGFVYNVASLAPARAGYLAVYSHVRPQLTHLGFTFSTTCAAAVAVATVCMIMNPIWVVRTRLMTSHVSPTPRATTVVRSILQTAGARGLYAGVGVTLLGRTCESAVYWLVYESGRAPRGLTQNPSHPQTGRHDLHSSTATSSPMVPSSSSPSRTSATSCSDCSVPSSAPAVPCTHKPAPSLATSLQTAVASAVAKTAAVSAVYPYHVVVTRVRQQPLPPRAVGESLSAFLQGRASAVAAVLRGATADSVAAAAAAKGSGGPSSSNCVSSSSTASSTSSAPPLTGLRRGFYALRGAYSGLSIHLARAVPSTVVFFVLYEGILKSVPW